jgi:hypothetical protein
VAPNGSLLSSVLNLSSMLSSRGSILSSSAIVMYRIRASVSEGGLEGVTPP